jgi:hypothetical protein
MAAFFQGSYRRQTMAVLQIPAFHALASVATSFGRSVTIFELRF